MGSHSISRQFIQVKAPWGLIQYRPPWGLIQLNKISCLAQIEFCSLPLFSSYRGQHFSETFRTVGRGLHILSWRCNLSFFLIHAVLNERCFLRITSRNAFLDSTKSDDVTKKNGRTTFSQLLTQYYF